MQGPSGNTGAMSLVSLAAMAIVLIFCRVQTAFLQGLHGKPYGQHCHWTCNGRLSAHTFKSVGAQQQPASQQIYQLKRSLPYMSRTPQQACQAQRAGRLWWVRLAGLLLATHMNHLHGGDAVHL